MYSDLRRKSLKKKVQYGHRQNLYIQVNTIRGVVKEDG
jgi:hypothetical protein